LSSGTTGRHHGQLHCGARYAWKDPSIARECREESLVLKSIASECIEWNGGAFVALDEAEAALERGFIELCATAGIPAEHIEPEALLRLEPALSDRIKTAVLVPDASFDAFRLPMMFFAAASFLGAKILPWTKVVGMDASAGRLNAVYARKAGEPREKTLRIEADFFVNAAGAWAGEIGAMVGLSIGVTPAPGAMLAVRGRLIDRVISRLRPPSDGDILVPQRGLSIIGSTQRLTGHPGLVRPEPEDRDFLTQAGSSLVPAFSERPVHAIWAAARPLAGRSAPSTGDPEGRSLSRDFSVLDHEAQGCAGLATILGGKATVLRAMGEKAADLVCSRLGVSEPCRTTEYLLPSWRDFYKGAKP